MSRTTNNTNNIKSSRKFSLLLTVTALFLVLSITIAAWFATVNSTEIGFNTGDVTSGIKIWIASVDTYSNDVGYEVEESNRKFSDPYIVDGIPTLMRDDKIVEDATLLENYTFGLIDNLLAIRPDNITYLKVEVPEGANTIKFNIHYDKDKYEKGQHVLLFEEGNDGSWIVVQDDPEGTANRKTPVSDFLAIETDKDLCYLQFSYCTSSVSLGEGSAIYDAQKTTDTDGNEIEPILQFDNLCYFNEFDEEGIQEVTFGKGERYLYIKITPNFDAIGLSGIMNSLAYFDVEAEFEAFRMDSTTETQEITNP